MRSIFDGYLTPACATCPDWEDGTDPNKGFGCGTHYPISWCPHFAKMEKEEAEKMREKLHRCKNCHYYDPQTKRCGFHKKYTPRKSKCEFFFLGSMRGCE